MSIDDIYTYMRMYHNRIYNEIISSTTIIIEGSCRKLIPDDSKTKVGSIIEQTMMRLAYDTIKSLGRIHGVH